MKKILIILMLFIISCSNFSDEKIECYEDSDCVREGCSGQLCVNKGDEENIITTCEWKEEYSCYQTGKCGCIKNKCGWDKRTISCILNFN